MLNDTIKRIENDNKVQLLELEGLRAIVDPDFLEK